MILINNKKEWDNFKCNCNECPTVFPCIGIKKQESFGIMGDANVSYYYIIPKKYRANIELLQAYFQGFKDSLL